MSRTDWWKTLVFPVRSVHGEKGVLRFAEGQNFLRRCFGGKVVHKFFVRICADRHKRTAERSHPSVVQSRDAVSYTHLTLPTSDLV